MCHNWNPNIINKHADDIFLILVSSLCISSFGMRNFWDSFVGPNYKPPRRSVFLHHLPRMLATLLPTFCCMISHVAKWAPLRTPGALYLFSFFWIPLGLPMELCRRIHHPIAALAHVYLRGWACPLAMQGTTAGGCYVQIGQRLRWNFASVWNFAQSSWNRHAREVHKQLRTRFADIDSPT